MSSHSLLEASEAQRLCLSVSLIPPPPPKVSVKEPVPCTGHPFDLTKTRLQTAGPGVYTGAIDVVKKTLARDGVTGYGSVFRPRIFLH